MGSSLSRPRGAAAVGAAAALLAATAAFSSIPSSSEAFSFVAPLGLPSSAANSAVPPLPSSSSSRPRVRLFLSAAARSCVEEGAPLASSDVNAAAADDGPEDGEEEDAAVVAEYGRRFESLLESATTTAANGVPDSSDGGDDGDSALRAAEEMLLRTVDQYKNGGEESGGDGGAKGEGVASVKPTVKPTEHAFASLIEAWLGRAGRGPSQSSSTPSSSASDLRHRAVVALDAAAEAATRAEFLLDGMEELYEPDGGLYRGLVSAWCSVAIRAHADREAEEAAAAAAGGGESSPPPTEGEGSGDEGSDEPVSAAAASAASMDSRAAALRAVAILDRMERLYGEVGSDDLVPGLSTYETVAAVWRTLGEGSHAVPDANQQLDQVRRRRDAMHPPRDEDDAVTSVKIESHGDVLRILAQLDDADEVRKKFSYGKRTAFRDRKGKKVVHRVRRGVAPATLNYNIVIDALAKSGRVWAGQRAEDILDYMVERHQRGEDDTKPDVLTVNSVIDAWARSPVPDSAERAEAVLDKLRNWQLEGVLDDVRPDAATYNALINGWCLSSSAHGAAGNNAAERAENFLAEMEELYDADPGGDSSVKLDAVSYSSVLKAWAMQCRRPGSDPLECADRAERVLQRMHDRHRADPDMNASPDVRCFNALLDVHANGGGTVLGQRAMKTLRLMEEFAQAGNDLVRPDLYTYNTVLKALGNGGGYKAADRALELLQSMEKWSRVGDEKGKKNRLIPDVISYNTVIDALARRGDRSSALAAERLMKGMGRAAGGGGDGGDGGDNNGGPKPNARTVAGVMNAWALSGERNAARVAEALFDKFCNPERGGTVVPDAVVYNTLLNAWAKSGDRSAAQRAVDILERMEDEHRKRRGDDGDGNNDDGGDDVKPNVRTYTSALDALAKSQARWAPRRAESILDCMERSYLAGDDSVRPNARTYTAVMNCWARSRDRAKAVKAQNLLHRMEEQYRRGNVSARPNVVAYNVLLNACAHTGTPVGGIFRGRDRRSSAEVAADNAAAEEAFKIACLSFDELRTSSKQGGRGGLRPTHVSYAAFLGVCANLMPEGELRDDLASRIFRRCRGEGMASDLVLRRLRGAVSKSSDLYERLLEGRDEDRLPADWTKNVSYRVPAVPST